jgi:hypothetical protein
MKAVAPCLLQIIDEGSPISQRDGSLLVREGGELAVGSMPAGVRGRMARVHFLDALNALFRCITFN